MEAWEIREEAANVCELYARKSHEVQCESADSPVSVVVLSLLGAEDFIADHNKMYDGVFPLSG